MTTAPAKIYHVAERTALESAQKSGSYRASSLDSEGFIHCCTADQLEGVTSRYYSGQTDLTLLVLDITQLGAAPVMENTVGGDELFPHLYEAIPMDSVVQMLEFDSARVSELNLA